MQKIKTFAIIPARLESTRLPGKLLRDLCGKPLLQRVFENATSMGIFDRIYVATDSNEIEKRCTEFSCPVIKTSPDHSSGTSRIAEACQSLPEADLIINIQGDEPFIRKEQLSSLINGLANQDECQIGTLVYPSHNFEESLDPNIVKAVKDHQNHALYFSRYSIPYVRDGKKEGVWLHHLGVYGFKRRFLEAYPHLKDCELERREKLEQLKFLTNGYKILLVETLEKTVGIDTLEDFEKAQEIISKSKHS